MFRTNTKNIDNNDFDNDFDIDVIAARYNYEMYQEYLNHRQHDLIKKWCKEIKEASIKGETYIATERFLDNKNDKSKSLYFIDDFGDFKELPHDTSIQYFQKYFEERGFEVIKKECFPQDDNICYLQIIWVSLNNK